MVPLSKSKQLDNKLPLLKKLAQDCQVARLDLFGSVARQQPAAQDYDFLVQFQPLPALEHGRAYFRLWEALQDVLSGSVDLIEAEAASPEFLQAIGADLRTIYVYDS